MKTAIDLVTEFEGFRAKPYKCPAGKWTVGYGSTEWQGQPVTQYYPKEVDEVDALREAVHKLNELADYLANYNPWRMMNKNQRQATLDLAYNVGGHAVANSLFFNTLNANQLDDWNKATVNGKKVVLDGLTKRRAAEKALFLDKVDE